MRIWLVVQAHFLNESISPALGHPFYVYSDFEIIANREEVIVMDKASGKLTVFFEKPFWIGVFEGILVG